MRLRLASVSRGAAIACLTVGVLLVITALLAWYHYGETFAPNIVARVLFAETANCSAKERLLVAGVMRNRIGLPAFGNAPTLEKVVRQPGAFSCIGDPANGNWPKTRHPTRMTPAEQAIWQECLEIVAGEIPEARGPSGRPLVYYHDKSIEMPPSWDNPRWFAVRELSTTRLVFYSVTAALPSGGPER